MIEDTTYLKIFVITFYWPLKLELIKNIQPVRRSIDK